MADMAAFSCFVFGLWTIIRSDEISNALPKVLSENQRQFLLEQRRASSKGLSADLGPATSPFLSLLP